MSLSIGCLRIYLVGKVPTARRTIVHLSTLLLRFYGIVANKKVTHLCTELRCLPLCWKAFLENTTHQLHSRTASRSHQDNHLYVIGLQPLKHSLMPLKWMFIALRCRDLTRSSLAKSFTVFYSPLHESPSVF